MIARTLIIAVFAAALGLSACPAEASGTWDIIANGTQPNDLVLRGIASDGIQFELPLQRSYEGLLKRGRCD